MEQKKPLDPHCRIGRVSVKPDGVADPEFMRFMHDRPLRPGRFINAADYYAHWERRFMEVK